MKHMSNIAARPTMQGRILALDGLRGWAAFMVVGYHCLWELFGTLFPVLRSLPVSSLLNGSLAVNVFFVLSGFVLTRPGWRQDDKSVVMRQIVKRYWRLMPAVVALVVIVWAMMRLGLTQNDAAGDVVGRPEWLGRWLDFQPNLWSALKFGAFDVFLGGAHHDYDPFLWVLPNELWGALVVLGICGLERPTRWLYPLLALGTIWTFMYEPVLFCFLVGADLALLHADGWLRPWPDLPAVNAVSVLALIGGGVFLASGPYARYTSLVATMMVVVALCAPLVTRGLESGPSQFLGRVSFPLYLTQFVVLVGPVSVIIAWMSQANLLNFGTALATGLGAIALSLAGAVAFMPVERATLAISRTAGRQAWPLGHRRQAPSPAP